MTEKGLMLTPKEKEETMSLQALVADISEGMQNVKTGKSETIKLPIQLSKVFHLGRMFLNAKQKSIFQS